jgi:hypothetical protein
MLRPQRERKQTFKALQSTSNARSISQIVDSTIAKKRKLHAFQPVPAEQVAEPRILNHPLPHYQPPINLHLFHSRPRLRPQIFILEYGVLQQTRRSGVTLDAYSIWGWSFSIHPMIGRYRYQCPTLGGDHYPGLPNAYGAVSIRVVRAPEQSGARCWPR